MSTQNGKKSSSTNNSSGNTPSTTPVSAIVNSGPIQPISNPTNNAPKYGTLVPNRIFVGGISANTTEAELLELFSKYGTVKAAKIIQDRAGVSKGYGFITFETEEEAKRLQKESDNITLKERRLNIAPAIKKQPFSRNYETNSPPTINSAPAQYYIPTNSLPYFQSGVTYYTPPPPPAGDPNSQQQPIYPPPAVYQPPAGPPQTAAYPQSMIYPTQQVYMPQQFSYPPVPYDYNYYANGNPQFVVGNQGPQQHQQLQMQRAGSPTRAPCFNQQLPYGADAVYINMPMFGPMEGPPMYQDHIDMNNGNVAEEAYGFTRQPLLYPQLLPLPPSQSPLQQIVSNSSPESNIQRSLTPVVSVLTLEQRQEKDYRSMQSGRRPRTPNACTNGNFRSFGANTHVPFTNGNYYANSNTYSSFQQVTTSIGSNDDFGGPRQNDSTHKVPSRPPCTNNNNDKDTSAQTSRYASYRSSVQYKSATVDENKNLSVRVRNNFSTAVYHNSRNTFQNNRRGAHNNDNYHSRFYEQHRHPDKQINDLQRLPSWNRVEPPQTQINNNNSDSSRQMPALQSGSQNFAPPVRRNKRSVRRTTNNWGAPLSEIGAGDAPLPATEVGDCSKKLDNLKL